MSRITRKLLRYFMAVAVLLALIAFVGFYGIFRQYSFQHHKEELQVRAEIIEKRLGIYMKNCAQNQELSAYINVLDDIILSDTYFISREGESFTCSCDCGTTVTVQKKPTEEVRGFAEEVFETGTYKHIERKENGNVETYIGIPVKGQNDIPAVVVIVDAFHYDHQSFVYSVGILLFCLVVALALSIFFAFYLAKIFTSPIQKIGETTKKLAEGCYQVKTDVYDENEIGTLAKEVDVLAEKLASVEQMQKDYVTSISHELRTPVTVLRSSIEALNDGMVEEDEIEKYYGQMLSETISLERLVNDMLELSRLENEEFKLEKQEIDLCHVLEDAVRAIRMMSAKKNISIIYEDNAQEWHIKGDYRRLKQMFITVLDNAVKYSDEGKHIWIDIKTKSENCYVNVTDEGCGISLERQKHIFEKFYRTTEAGNTGMGLVVMKSIAKRHGIEVRLHSEENKGTRFTFIIPSDE